ncbi:hypothetical protein BTUL_0066g00310 [Botrytis tulipae]|uniref:Uncharacterized protein n=1 Tax=Botrytis tulipae TaxID=87230 RepID=A0A4Z1ES61_9HELO|nr:hypothetical protein BTUL_0066g00310 [Botrytis tulipae]
MVGSVIVPAETTEDQFYMSISPGDQRSVRRQRLFHSMRVGLTTERTHQNHQGLIRIPRPDSDA